MSAAPIDPARSRGDQSWIADAAGVLLARPIDMDENHPIPLALVGSASYASLTACSRCDRC